MEFGCHILEIAAEVRIVGGSKHHFLEEEVSNLGRIRGRIQPKDALVNFRIDVSYTIDKSGLPRDILFRDATIVVLQQHLLHLHRPNLCDGIRRQLATRLQSGTAIGIQIVRVAIVVGFNIVNVSEAVLLIHQCVDHNQVRRVSELNHFLQVLDSETLAYYGVDIDVACEHRNNGVFVAKVNGARDVVGSAVEELGVEAFAGWIHAARRTTG